MEWQPIETAPKDGTWFLARGGKQEFEQWDDQEDRAWPPCYVVHWESFFDTDKGDWIIGCVWDGELRSEYKDPTHWMPLPSPRTEP